MRFTLYFAFCGGAVLSLPPAFAQSNPTDASARVPAFRHESALADYRPHKDQPLANWRAINDEVAKIGGHLGILRGGHAAHSASQAGKMPPAGHKGH